MLNKRIINTGGGGAACTTDTTQILDAGSTQSLALYRFEDNANDTAYATGSIVSSNRELDLNANGYSGYGDWLDSSGNNNNGVISGATYTNDGNSDYFDFDGSNDYINVAGSDLNPANTKCIELWFNTDSTSEQYIISNNNGSGAYGYHMGITGGKLFMWIYSQAQNAYFINLNGDADLAINTGEWNHAVWTMGPNASDNKIYLNGNLGQTASSTSGTFPSTNAYNGINIGKYTSSGWFNGKLAQVRAYSTALTEAQISQNFNATRGLYSNYNGAASGVTYVTGKFGKAASFDGSNDYIDLGDTIATSTRAISMWVNADDFSERWPFQQGDGQGTENYIRFYNTDDIQVRWGNITQTFSGYSANTWYHIVAQKDENNNANVWINGVEMGSSGSPSSITVNKTQIGRRYNNGAYQYYFKGEIDQVRIFDTALTSGEVNSLYNETATSAALGTIDSPSTVAYYKMADATDETGSYNGTPTNVDFNVQGKYGFAGKFNGSSSKIDLGNNPSNNSSTFSVSLWFKTNGHSGTATIINNGGANSGEKGYALRILSSGYLRFGTNELSSAFTSDISVDYADNNWHHVAISYNKGTYDIYVDDVLKANGTNGTFVSTATRPTWIGQFSYTPSNIEFFNGQIDQVRLFNKAISAAEVTTLYNEVQCANPITTPEDYFNTKLYTGNGGTQAITGVGFAPGMTWIKARSVGYSHSLQDTLRGPGTSTSLYPDLSSAEGTYGAYGQISAFGTDGFTVASGGHGSYPTAQVNQNGVTYASWNWKAASSNTTNNDGTITSTVRASQESGFSIVKYTGNATSGATFGHGLNSKPELILIKNLDHGGNYNWTVYSGPNGATGLLYLNLTDAFTSTSSRFNNTEPTSSVVTLGNDGTVNDSGDDHIAYCFANIDGYQRIGSFIGNGSANGPFIYTGFEPAWIIFKNTDTAYRWYMLDNKRNTTNPRRSRLFAEAATAETTNSDIVDFHTNGFQIKNSDAEINKSGDKILFWAIAANPDTTAPTKANSFKTVLYNGTGSSQSITGTGFKPDLTWIKNRANGVTNSWHTITDSVRGGGTRLWPNATNAEAADNYDVLSFQNDGFTIGTGTYSSYSGGSFVSWSWKGLDHDRNLATVNNDGSITSLVSANPAAGFSVVKWTGTGVDGTKIGHGLEGSPEMIITKGLSNATSWVVGVGGISGLSVNDYFTLTAYAKSNLSNFYQAYSTNTFQVGVSSANEMNKSSSNQYISYCFRTIAGHSKAGKYTGTGVSGLEIALDFSPSFLLVKGAGATGWIIIDNQRPTPGGNYELYPHLSNSEDTSATSFLLGTNKFTVNSTGTWHNINGTDYIYLAIK